MRQIGSLPDPSEAERFTDYLLTLGIASRPEYSESASDWQIWVENDDHLEQAATELASFTATPNDPRYATAVKTAQAVRAEQDRAEAKRRKNFVDVRTKWATPQQWRVPITLFLITAAIIVSVLTHLGDDPRPNPTSDALRFGGVQRYVSDENGREFAIPKPGLTAIVHDHQAWRLFTPIFLHFGFLHILFNAFWMRDLGAMIESRRNPLWFLFLVLAIAALSNFAEFYVDVRGDLVNGLSPNFGGLSGVVYGLLGYAWVQGRVNPTGGIGVPSQTWLYMMVWLVLCMTGIIGPVANTAHVVGLVVGIAFGYVPRWVRLLSR